MLKTHQLMRLTGGVKLTFGCIPGLAKAQLHVRASRREDFADMLLDLHLAMAPRFTIIDGIIAMEGQGPGGGDPRELGSLFAARDCVALDAALADRTAHERRDVHVLAAAERRGLIDLDDPYELSGDPIEPATDFVPAGRDVQDRVPAGLRRLGRQLVTARPRLVDPAACTECGECAADLRRRRDHARAAPALRRPPLRALLRLHRGLPHSSDRQRDAAAGAVPRRPLTYAARRLTCMREGCSFRGIRLP